MTEQNPTTQKSSNPSLIWGFLVIFVGVALFAEQLGLIDKNIKWFLPALVIAIGANMIYENHKKSLKNNKTLP